MRREYSRSVHVPVPVKRVRRSMKFSCGKRGLRRQISRIAQHYGLVDEGGSPHDAEIVRLLLITKLTENMPNRVETAVEIAVRVQRPMLASALGTRIGREYATNHIRGQGRKGSRWVERRNQARVTFGKWIHEALEGIALYWQDELGVVRDTKMVADLCMMALDDPDLPAVLHWYVQRTAMLRQKLAQAEGWIRQIVSEAMADEQPEQRRSA